MPGNHVDTAPTLNDAMNSINQVRLRPPAQRRPIGVALQGGGSWGAYTWGALDALLASRSVTIAQLSGTSAGAINAAIVASALAKGSRAQARKALLSFWLSIADPTASAVVRSLWAPFERQWQMNDWLLPSRLMSLHGAARVGIHPLRDAIATHVDIDAIRSKAAPALFVTLTDVRTGRPRVISNDTMSIDALLASACLPDLYPAVEIAGEHYWDGGYGGNPTLWPMLESRITNDIVIVQLMPDRVDEVPTDALAIRRRVEQIVFNSSLVAEMQAIHAMRLLAQRHAPARPVELRFHRIGPPRLELFGQGHGGERASAWLRLLYEEGLLAGRRFIAHHALDIGRRETLDIAGTFVDAPKPKIPMPESVAAHDDVAAVLSRAA